MPNVSFDGLLAHSTDPRYGSAVKNKHLIIAVKTDRFGIVQVIQERHPQKAAPRTAKDDPNIQMFPSEQQRKIVALCAATWGAIFGNEREH
jgi:hypothetical protein